MNEITRKELAPSSSLGGSASFLATVSQQDREDIKLANLMVHLQVLGVEGQAEAIHWFDNYQLKLQALAKPAVDCGFDPAVLEIIAQTGRADSIVTQWALDSMNAQIQSGNLFEAQVKRERRQVVQLLPCASQGDGCVVLILHYLEVEVIHKRKGVFSLHSKRDDNSLSERVAAVTFDPAVFRREHRQRVFMHLSELNRQSLQQFKLRA